MKLPPEIQFIENAFKRQRKTDARMDGKLTVITGATSGVGYFAAKRLAEAGSSLVLVVRNKKRAAKVCEELQTLNVKCDAVIADFSDLNKVRQAASQILAKYRIIDVLINNAGMFRTVRELSENGTELVFLVNHLASFLFTRLLLERMISSAPSRIIMVNSQGHRFGGLDIDDLNWDRRLYNGYQGYGASKTAQLMTVWELADLLKDTHVTVNAVHPGSVRSNIGMDNGLIYRLYQRHLLWPFLRSAKISGEAIYYLAASPEMNSVSGKYLNRTIEESPMPHALDRKLGKRVWKISEKMTDLPNMKLK